MKLLGINMSRLNTQLTDLIKDKLKINGPDLNAEIKFDKNFIGFNGHFPENPVLPGVVMIKVMIVMIELCKQKRYTFKDVKCRTSQKQDGK